MAALGRKLGFNLSQLSDVRKAVVTLAVQKFETDRASLAEHMCHSVSTARRFYDASETKVKKSKGYMVSSAIIHDGKDREKEAEKPQVWRRKYSKGEEELLCSHFAESIAARKPSIAMMAQEFLQLNPNSFHNRSLKDIIDKVRSVIRRVKTE